MLKPRRVLVSTVGTSLVYPNLDGLAKRLEDFDRFFGGSVEERKRLDREGVDFGDLKKKLENIRDLYNIKNWSQLAKILALLPPYMRVCGAEINSIFSMKEKGFINDEVERLVFFYSDTKLGEDMAKILKAYFENVNFLKVRNIEIIKIEGLKDDNPKEFKNKGLRNLVRRMGEVYRSFRYTDMGINATGGYKAQIALAVAFGVVANVPVYYKHERFDQIITFPQVPFSVDLGVIEENLAFWLKAIRNEAFSEGELFDLGVKGEYKDKILPLLEEVEDKAGALYELSPLGYIYWEKFISDEENEKKIYEFVNMGNRLLEPAEERKGLKFRDDNYPKGFKDYVEKVYAENDFISEIHTLPYDKMKDIQSKGKSFYIYDSGSEEEAKIVGTYVDKDNFGARFEVMTRAMDIFEKKYIVQYLNDWLKRRG